MKHFETIQQIANSKGLISTSPMEGFPNVFIEAWACGIPVFSLYFDPHVIEKEKLGMVAHGNLDELIEEIKNYKYDENFTKRVATYIENNHLLNTKKINELNKIILELFHGNPKQ